MWVPKRLVAVFGALKTGQMSTATATLLGKMMQLLEWVAGVWFIGVGSRCVVHWSGEQVCGSLEWVAGVWFIGVGSRCVVHWSW
jgi:hypothetical protein